MVEKLYKSELGIPFGFEMYFFQISLWLDTIKQ